MLIATAAFSSGESIGMHESLHECQACEPTRALHYIANRLTRASELKNPPAPFATPLQSKHARKTDTCPTCIFCGPLLPTFCMAQGLTGEQVGVKIERRGELYNRSIWPITRLKPPTNESQSRTKRIYPKPMANIRTHFMVGTVPCFSYLSQ